MDGRINDFSVTDIRAALKPTKAIPIDARCMFSSKKAAEAAAKTAVAVGEKGSNYYIGQKLCVYDAVNKTVSWYTISALNTLVSDEFSESVTVNSSTTEKKETVLTTITFDFGGKEQNVDIEIPKGKDGADGTSRYKVVAINDLGEVSNGIKYQMVFSDNSKFEFIAPKGKDGHNGGDGLDGVTPHIGANGNWWLEKTDTGVKARGDKGEDGKDGVVLGIDGFYYLDVDNNNDLVVHYNDGDKVPNFIYDEESGNLSVEIGTNVYATIGNIKGEKGDPGQGVDLPLEKGAGTNAIIQRWHGEATGEATGTSAFAMNLAKALHTRASAFNKGVARGEDSFSANAAYASHLYSAAFGLGTDTGRESQLVCGEYNAANANALFAVGNGDAANRRSTAFEVLKDGTAKVGGKKVATIDDVTNFSFRVAEDGTVYFITED